MNSADRIKALCEEALKSPEAPAAANPAASQPLEPTAAANVPEPEADEAVDAETADMAVATNPEGESDPELRAMLEDRDRRLQGRHRRVKWAVNALLLALVAGPIAAVVTIPELRGKFETFVGHLDEGVDDVKSLGKTNENYDEALEKIAVRGTQIDDASRSIGADPSAVSAEDDPEMTAELSEFGGETADDIETRKKRLRVMGRLTGADAPD